MVSRQVVCLARFTFVIIFFYAKRFARFKNQLQLKTKNPLSLILYSLSLILYFLLRSSKTFANRFGFSKSVILLVLYYSFAWLYSIANLETSGANWGDWYHDHMLTLNAILFLWMLNLIFTILPLKLRMLCYLSEIGVGRFFVALVIQVFKTFFNTNIKL